MENSKLGYHTYSLTKSLTVKDAYSLLRHFYLHMDNTGEIRVRPDKNNMDIQKIEDSFLKTLYSEFPKRYIIEYINRYKGIKWGLRISNKSPGFMKGLPIEDRPCGIKAKINPKLLAGIKDYISAANEDDIRIVKALFNEEAAKISPLLGEYDSYSLNRIDYCLNGDIYELDVGCSAAQMILLMKRADTAHFQELENYDNVSHRKKTDKYSFYLKSGAVNINCYWPYDWQHKKYSACSDIEKAHDIIRFETQCKYSKVYAMLQNIKRAGYTGAELTYRMLSDEMCADIARHYFLRTVGNGNYFRLDNAIEMVRLMNYRYDKEQRLIDALKRVNRCRGIPKAKTELQGKELEIFKLSLSDLNDIGVNPVTVPKEWSIRWRTNQWGIKYIPNILNAFYEKLSSGNAPLTKEMKMHLSEYYLEKL